MIEALTQLLQRLHDTFGWLISVIQAAGWIWSLLVIGVGAITPYLFWRSERYSNRFTKVFFPRDTREFYIYFGQVIRRARKKIYHTGDGFNLRNQQSKANSDILDQAFVAALRRGVVVKRFQIVNSATINWFGRLRYLKEKYPRQFRVFINESHDGIGSFCVTDPGMRRTVFEHQLLTGPQLARGTEPHDFAFVHGHQAKSDRAQKLLESIFANPNTVELSLPDLAVFQERLWEKRFAEFRADPKYIMIDPEMVEAVSHSGGKPVPFDRSQFPIMPVN